VQSNQAAAEKGNFGVFRERAAKKIIGFKIRKMGGIGEMI
jgi:hypothetical protein